MERGQLPKGIRNGLIACFKPLYTKIIIVYTRLILSNDLSKGKIY